MLRRVGLIVLCWFAKAPEYPLIIQILLVQFTNLVWLIYIGLVRPFKLKSENKFSLFHEFMICTITQQSLLFTDFTSSLEVEERYILSWIPIAFITCWCFLDLLIVIKNALYTFKLIIIKYSRVAYSFLENRGYILKFKHWWSRIKKQIKPNEQ